MNENDNKIINDFKKRITPMQMLHIKRLVVFGSRAKGVASVDSDLDMIALVDMKTPELEKELSDIAYQVMWDNNFHPIISLKVFDESRYSEALSKGYSFYRHVEHEGVVV